MIMIQEIELEDQKFMRLAIIEARNALEKGEVPIGAVVVCQGQVIARAHNLVETLTDPTAHAEMQAITAATNTLGGKYLTGCTLYVTLEPCPMCAGALYLSQVSRVIYGSKDPKRGYTTVSDKMLHPKTIVRTDVCEKECAEMLTVFFEELRKKKSSK